MTTEEREDRRIMRACKGLYKASRKGACGGNKRMKECLLKELAEEEKDE